MSGASGAEPWMPELDVPAEHLRLDELLVRAGQAMARLQQQAAAEHGLTPTALAVLAMLDGAEALSQRDLAARVGVTPATLTPVLDALDRDALVTRSRAGTDRRALRVVLTPAGRERLAAAEPDVAARVEAVLPGSAAAERQIRAYLLAVLDHRP